MSSKPSIDAFLSYHTNDKEIALKIKEKLGELGIQVFLAPDDIDGGDKFLTVMYEKIKTCQIFFVLLSKDFTTSQYSDQEVGIALGREKPIIPICIDETIPYGFLREYHCVCSNGQSVEQKIAELSDLVMKYTDTGREYIDLLINNLENADSFMDAFRWANKLSEYSKFNQEQILRIANARISNSQIHNSFMACPVVDGIIERQKKLLPAEIRSHLSV